MMSLSAIRSYNANPDKFRAEKDGAQAVRDAQSLADCLADHVGVHGFPAVLNALALVASELADGSSGAREERFNTIAAHILKAEYAVRNDHALNAATVGPRNHG